MSTKESKEEKKLWTKMSFLKGLTQEHRDMFSELSVRKVLKIFYHYFKLSPYNLEQLNDCNLKTITEIGIKGYTNLFDRMKTIQQDIGKIEPTSLMNDDYWKEHVENLPIIYECGKKMPFTLQFADAALKLSSSFLDKLLVKASFFTKQQQIVIKSIFLTYFQINSNMVPVFQNMDLQLLKKYGSKRKIGIQVDKIRSPNDNLFKILTALVSGSGPILLKVIQQFAPEDKNADVYMFGGKYLRDFIKDVFDGVPGLTDDEKEYIIANLHELPDDTKIGKRLGSASIAEAYQIKYHGKKQEGVLKLLKPQYLNMFFCECQLLLTHTWEKIGTMVKEDTSIETDQEKSMILKQSRQLLLFLIKYFTNEFNIESEAKLTDKGYNVYNDQTAKKFGPNKSKSINLNKEGLDFSLPGTVKSIKMVKYETNPFPYLLQTLAPGKSLKDHMDPIVDILNLTQQDADEKYRGEDVAVIQKTKLETYKNKINQITSLMMLLVAAWLFEAYFGTGFFHADLHPGNILLDLDKNEVWLIDYGSASTFEKENQCYIFNASFIASKLEQFCKYLPMEKPCDISWRLQQGHNLKTYKEYNNNSENSYLSMNDILQYYQTAKLSPHDWSKLNSKLMENKDQVEKDHKHNLTYAKYFFTRIKKLCDLESENITPLDLLNYSKEMDMPSLFLNFAKSGKDIGKCAENNMVFFARGIRYVMVGWTELRNAYDIINPGRNVEKNVDELVKVIFEIGILKHKKRYYKKALLTLLKGQGMIGWDFCDGITFN